MHQVIKVYVAEKICNADGVQVSGGKLFFKGVFEKLCLQCRFEKMLKFLFGKRGDFIFKLDE